MKQLDETRGDSVEEPLTATLSLSNLTTEQMELLDSDQLPMYISIDLNVPGAETGPETMPALRLCARIKEVEGDRFPLPPPPGARA